MLRIKNVNKYFNKGKKSEIHVINNVNLELGNAGLVALLGPSGSGKTTLLNTIGGLDKIKSGSIYIDNEKITSKLTRKIDKIRNLNIGYIFQDYKLLDDETVFDNVALYLKLVGIKDKTEIKERVNFVLEKVGIYRFRNRPAGTLSGGERQRVGIARALVKNPKILLCDEPTGNLDSKNSLEIMNIIKAISKERLVILVTHERNLAEFFASRIIEIQDGTIIKDYINEHNDGLDYKIDNRIYLKDFKNHENFGKENINIDLYSDNNNNINLKIVVKGNNIYITSDNLNKDIISDTTDVEFIDDHYKSIVKSEIDKYDYNFSDVFKQDRSLKYSSIFNVFSFIQNGFKKVFKFSKLKKILLIGFFLSGIFTMYSISSIFANATIKDEDFVDINKNYLVVKSRNMAAEDYLKYEKDTSINYILPTDSKVELSFVIDDFYQVSNVRGTFRGSLASKSMIKDSDVILGTHNSDEYSIVLDKMVVKKVLAEPLTKMAGIVSEEDIINRKVSIVNFEDFTITGIVDTGSPSIYMDERNFINILSSSSIPSEGISSNMFTTADDYSKEYQNNIYDYNLLLNKIEIKKGRLPENDYEVIVNIDNKYAMELNKEIDFKVNNHKLKVVGYYDSKNGSQYYLVNPNTIKYNLLANSNAITIYSNNVELTKEHFNNNKLNIYDSYNYSKDMYLNAKKDKIKSSITVSGIILLISLIEIYLMIRASFLSRIREVGIYRAIGVKKSDIYKMFIGEIISITTLTNVPAIIITARALKRITSIELLSNQFIVNPGVIILSILFMYTFNIVVGLLPVFATIIKTPSSILSRYDLD